MVEEWLQSAPAHRDEIAEVMRKKGMTLKKATVHYINVVNMNKRLGATFKKIFAISNKRRAEFNTMNVFCMCGKPGEIKCRGMTMKKLEKETAQP